MKISIATLFPDLYTPFVNSSLIQRATAQGLISINVLNMFSLCAPKERIDAPTFGHGSGMLIKPTIVEKAVDILEADSSPAFKIFFSPRGKKLDQDLLKELYEKIITTGGHLALFPARYEGMDARTEAHYADEIISIGDYVLMGGDLPAMVLIESLLRLVPDVVGRQESVQEDSFSGPFVDYPAYTAPVEWKGYAVPEVIRSGNHQAMKNWRHSQAVKKTAFDHFEWLRQHDLSQAEGADVLKVLPRHYAVLMHDAILLPDGTEGTSSVTSIDMHDIARSACTYGLHEFFIVTPLEDQQKIVGTLLDFWQKGTGVTYNPDRHRAVSAVSCKRSLNEVIASITKIEGVEPLLIATSAQGSVPDKTITYFDQQKVWEHNRPVLFIFGTGHGLGQSIINRVEYILLPLKGFSDFNHLSVRSAAAIVFDRWLGVNLKKVNKL